MNGNKNGSQDDVLEMAADAELILITADRLAGMLQVSTRTLWRLLSAGKLIQPIRIGGSVRWRFLDVRRWIDEGCPPPLRRNN